MDASQLFCRIPVHWTIEGFDGDHCKYRSDMTVVRVSYFPTKDFARKLNEQLEALILDRCGYQIPHAKVTAMSYDPHKIVPESPATQLILREDNSCCEGEYILYLNMTAQSVPSKRAGFRPPARDQPQSTRAHSEPYHEQPQHNREKCPPKGQYYNEDSFQHQNTRPPRGGKGNRPPSEKTDDRRQAKWVNRPPAQNTNDRRQPRGGKRPPAQKTDDLRQPKGNRTQSELSDASQRRGSDNRQPINKSKVNQGRRDQRHVKEIDDDTQPQYPRQSRNKGNEKKNCTRGKSGSAHDRPVVDLDIPFDDTKYYKPLYREQSSHA